MRLFFLLLLFVFVVLSNRYGLQGVGVGVLEGEEGVWKQRQSFRRMKTNASQFFFGHSRTTAVYWLYLNINVIRKNFIIIKFREDRRQILVARNIYMSLMFINMMPKMCLCNCWFSHDVTKIQTKKLWILPRFYLHDAFKSSLKTIFHTNFLFKRVLAWFCDRVRLNF